MLGEVIKFIMRIADIVNWFIKPRTQIKPAENKPKDDGVWSKEKQQYWRGYVSHQLQKNPAYKSSNGF